MVELHIDAGLSGRVRLGLLELDGLAADGAAPGLEAETAALVRELQERHAGVSSGEVPGAAEVRALYKSLGLDPTKTRPASEALLRRVLKGEALPRVNPLVDGLNLCSLRTQLPFGLYDRAKLVPPLALRLGQPGESYEGIRKGPVNLAGRPLLADAQGPFGNPSSDSLRTCVGPTTRAALVVVYAPVGLTPARLDAVLDATRDTLVRHCGGGERGRAVVPAA